MKVEFRCDQCDRLLRVNQAHAGSLIACPACQFQLVVPKAESLQELESDHTSEIAPQWNPQPVSFQIIFADTWTLYVENLWMLLGVAFVDLLLWILGIGLILLPAVGTFAVLINAIGLPPPLSVLGMILVLLLGFIYLVNAMTCSQTKFFLKVARGEPTKFLDAFHIGWRKGAITMLPTVFGVFCVSGFMLCAFPGVFVYLFFWPYIWVWADRQTGEQESYAFPLAKDLTIRNLSSSIAIAAIDLGLTVFALKFLFGQSLVGVLKAVAYLHMSGQEVTGINRLNPKNQTNSEGADPA